jgi:hypothetical protein
MQGPLLILLAVHFVLTALPAVAAIFFARRLGVTQVPLLLVIGLAATGAVAMLGFWTYFADPLAGRSLSYFVLFGSALYIGWAVWDGGIDRELLRKLAVPAALWALGSAFLIFFGFLHGDPVNAMQTAATRYRLLPSDNDLPRFFEAWYYHHGHSGEIPFYPPDWLSSDRPPLQIGYGLVQRPFLLYNEVTNYQVLAVMLQQLWIVALWALLLAARVGRLTRGLILCTVLVSDLALVNGFFVWPKMLPAALLVAAAALVLTPLWHELRSKLWVGVLVGGLFGLAMMGHGSSFFGIVPLALIAAFRGMPSWRWIGVAVATGLVLVASWTAYQKYFDPPGDRLPKLSLAGLPEKDDRGLGEAVVDAYSEAGLGGTIHNKAENFVTMAGGGPAAALFHQGLRELTGSGGITGMVEQLRDIYFYGLLPSLGLLLIAPFVMLAGRRRGRRRPQEWSFALSCWLTVAVGAFAWGLIAFGNLAARTILHTGSYLLPLLAFAGAVAGLRATFPRFAVWYSAIAAAVMLAIYTPVLYVLPGTSYSALSASLAAVFLVAFIAVSLAPSGAGRESAAGAPSAGAEPAGQPAAAA